jgi:hypothetical protein
LRSYHPEMADAIAFKFFSLGYYFLRVVEFPTDNRKLEFPTALRLFDPHDDFPTKIEPTTVRGLADDLEAFQVTTFTEYFTPVFAGDRWHDHYFTASEFTALLWREKGLLIAAAGREVVNGFVRTTKEKSGGVIYLQSLNVNLERLASNTPNARALTLEQTQDSGLPGHIKRLRAVGRNVEQSSEIQSYKAKGAVGSGMEFDFPFEGIAEIRLSVTSDGSVRLHNHLGDKGNPNVPIELRVVRACWSERVEMYSAVKSPLPQRAKKGDGPSSVKGQQTFDKLLEP